MARAIVQSRLAFVAVLLAGCSGGGTGSSPLGTQTAEPLASPSPNAMTAAVSVEIDVPSRDAATPSAGDVRHRAFISPAAQSVVATIDEPNIAQTALQHRVESQNVTPNQNTYTFYAPPGTLTIKLSLFDAPNGTGKELARTVPSNASPPSITLAPNQNQTLNVTFNPIVVAGLADRTSTYFVQQGLPGGSGSCSVIGGYYTLEATDQDGYVATGPGMYLDVTGAPFSVSLASVTQGSSGILGLIYGNLLTTATSGKITSAESVATFEELPPPQLTGPYHYYWAVNLVSTTTHAIVYPIGVIGQYNCGTIGG